MLARRLPAFVLCAHPVRGTSYHAKRSVNASQGTHIHRHIRVCFCWWEQGAANKQNVCARLAKKGRLAMAVVYRSMVLPPVDSNGRCMGRSPEWHMENWGHRWCIGSSGDNEPNANFNTFGSPSGFLVRRESDLNCMSSQGASSDFLTTVPCVYGPGSELQEWSSVQSTTTYCPDGTISSSCHDPNTGITSYFVNVLLKNDGRCLGLVSGSTRIRLKHTSAPGFYCLSFDAWPLPPALPPTPPSPPPPTPPSPPPPLVHSPPPPSPPSPPSPPRRRRPPHGHRPPHSHRPPHGHRPAATPAIAGPAAAGGTGQRVVGRAVGTTSEDSTTTAIISIVAAAVGLLYAAPARTPPSST